MASWSSRQQPPQRVGWRPWLRRTDQRTVAMLVCVALTIIAAYWLVMGGPRSRLVEIDLAPPRHASFKVDINHAEWPELAQLPGVGETLARRIVADRQRSVFRTCDDLLRVDGIGPATLQQIEPYLASLPSN